jgi:hypothetical protein
LSINITIETISCLHHTIISVDETRPKSKDMNRKEFVFVGCLLLLLAVAVIVIIAKTFETNTPVPDVSEPNTTGRFGITRAKYNISIVVLPSYLPARCLYNKVRYFRAFYVLVVGGAYVYNVRYQVSLL